MLPSFWKPAVQLIPNLHSEGCRMRVRIPYQRLLTLGFLVIALVLAAGFVAADDPEATAELPGWDQETFTYQVVIEVPDKSADDLYLLSRQWVAETFRDISAIQFDDRDRHMLIIRGAWSTKISHGMYMIDVVLFEIKLEMRDGRCRMKVFNLMVGMYARFDDEQRSEAPIKDAKFWINTTPKAAKKRQKILSILSHLHESLLAGLQQDVAAQDDDW